MAVLSAEQIGSFAEQGYLILPGLVSPADTDQAQAEVDRIVAAAPPPDGTVGPHFYWHSRSGAPGLFGLLARPGGLLDTAAELTGPPGVEIAFGQVQVALNIPPFSHRPGLPHIDGYREGQPVPATFTLLAGLMLSDQLTENGGNLWVWPGTHLQNAAFFAEHGPEAFEQAAGYSDITLPEPVQILGSRGDVLLAHYLLGHNIGGNYSGGTVRRMLYARLRMPGHETRWAECLTDPWQEFPAVRTVSQPRAPGP
jgi:hypothetical protein